MNANDRNRARPLVLSLALLLAACASEPRQDEASVAAAKGDRATASELYAGQPAVVHATEYPVESYEDGMKRGDEAWRQGKLDLAIYLYVQSLAFDASHAEPFVRIGFVHEQLGNPGLAAKAYEFALERAPDNAAVCERLGLLYLQADRNEAARQLFARAVALDPKRVSSHNGLGVVADRGGDYSLAIRHYDDALALDARSAVVLNNRGYSRFLAGDPDSARRDLREAIALGAGRGAWVNLGRVEASQERYAEALECFVRETDRATAYNLLGEAAFRNRDYARAKRYFESAIEAAPRYFEVAQRNLALAEERLAASSPAPVAPPGDATALPTVLVAPPAPAPSFATPPAAKAPPAKPATPVAPAERAATPVALPMQAPVAAVARTPATVPARAPVTAVARSPGPMATAAPVTTAEATTVTPTTEAAPVPAATR